MSNLAVDSCVIAKWFLPESDSAQAQKLFADVIARGDRLIVLDLALAEVTNVIWKHFRAGRLTADEARAYVVDLQAVSVHFEPFSRYLDAALEIAM